MKNLMNTSYNNSTGVVSYICESSAENNSLFELVDTTNDFDLGRYSIYEIANWFLNKEVMTQKKLQKLCYYAQAWYYTLNNLSLCDANFEAWIHGPVSPVLYDRFKNFGFSGIKLKGNYISCITEEDQRFLERVWATYGEYTGNALEALSHSEPPWKEARTGYSNDERCNKIISLESMKRYFSSISVGSTSNGF